MTEEQFDKIFGLNVRGTLFTVQKALPLFADGGSIIMNGSIAGSMGFPAFGVYSATRRPPVVREDLDGGPESPQHSRERLQPGTIDTPILEGVPKDALDGFIALTPEVRWDAPRRSRPPRCSWRRAIRASSRGASFFYGGTAQI